MTHRRAATVLSLTLAACLAACGDERVPAPVSPAVAGAPIAGAPIAGTPVAGAPIAGTPAAPAAPTQPADQPTTSPTTPPAVPAPESTSSAAAPSAPPSVPPTPAAPAAPAPETALGDTAHPDPTVPGEDPIVAAQARAVSEAAAASRTAADKPAPEAPAPKKVVEEKPVAGSDPKKADPKKAGAKDEKPELIGFDVLGAFEYTAPNPEVPGSFEKAVASIPEDIRNLGGRTVTVEGYMIPLEYAPDDDGVKSFFLSRYQVGCCFGVMPRANELVEVTMEGPKWAPYVSWMPVRATGVIVVGPKEGDTATLSGIFRMHNPEVTVPEPEEVELKSDHAR